MTQTNLSIPTVVLVHAAWADASSWSKIIPPVLRKKSVLQMEAYFPGYADVNCKESQALFPQMIRFMDVLLNDSAAGCVPVLRASNRTLKARGQCPVNLLFLSCIYPSKSLV